MSDDKFEYEVIVDWELKDFRGEINACVNDGWVCQGGVSIAISENGTRYYVQALLREKK
jgi:hypothetical protein